MATIAGVRNGNSKLKQSMQTIQTYEQLKGICQAIYYCNQLSEYAIEEEKEFDIEVWKTDATDEFRVVVSYIEYYIEATHESEPHTPSVYKQIFTVKIGDSVKKVVKDILNEIDTIYDAEIPEVKSKKELKELANNEY